MQNKEPNFNLNNSRLRLVSGTSNPKLAVEIASYLGIENVPLISKRFADGELYVQIQQSIRGCDDIPPQPLNNATVSGMEVIGTFFARIAPNKLPIIDPIIIQIQD